MNDIKCVKFTSGEEIITQIENKLTTENVKCFTLTKPVRIGVTQDGQMVMSPWLMFSNQDEVVIEGKNVLYITDIHDEIKNAYNEKFGSGIVTAPASVILQG